MTRRSVYAGGLAIFLAAFAMTLTSISLPQWISWDVTDSPGAPVHHSYGLHHRCSSVSDTCEPFPTERDCLGHERYFCSLWRSVGFIMSFTVVLEGMTLLAFLILVAGGKQRRVFGWRVLTGMLLITGLVEAAGMSIVAYVFDNDDRFFPGWKLDVSFGLCTASWSLLVLSAAGIASSAFVLPDEAGYELIPDESQ